MLRNKLYVYGDERLEVPSHLHFGKDMLDRMREYGDHPALIADNDDTMTFGQLAQKMVDIALSLARIGVRKGDVVSICSEKRIELLPTIIGVFCTGAVFSFFEVDQGSLSLLHRANISKPKVIFMSPEAYDLHKTSFDAIECVQTYVVFGDKNKEGGVLFKDFLTETCDMADFVPTPVEGWKDLALMLFSSGTTGMPKGVPCTHLAFLMRTASSTNESFRYSSVLITDEWSFSYGLEYTLSCLRRGVTCIFTLENDPHRFLLAVEKYKVKVVQAVPCFVNLLIKSLTLHQYDVSSVEAIMSASSPLSREQIEGVLKRFQHLRDVHQIYGMSEAGPICSDVYSPKKHGSVGTVLRGFIIKVVDIETREVLGPNQRGEICIKSPTLMPGYVGVDNTDLLDPEGFFKTGDVGYYDNERHFYVVNRVKELIKYEDISLAPAELEAILLSDARVRDAGIAASGEYIAAFVVLQPHAVATPQELLNYLHDNITSIVRIKGGVHFVPTLPRVAGNKLNRAALQQMLLQLCNSDATSRETHPDGSATNVATTMQQ